MRSCWLYHILFFFLRILQKLSNILHPSRQNWTTEVCFFCKRKIIHENIWAKYFSPIIFSWSVSMKITGDSLNYSSMLLLKCDTQACSRSQLRAKNWDKLKQYGCLSTTSLFSWPQSKNLKNPKCLSHVIELYPGSTHEYCN